MKKRWMCLIILFLILFAGVAIPDTINLKDGTQHKGIVVEEYSDRVILSTPDGELQILNNDIVDIQYDEVYQNLVALGKQYELKGNFLKASDLYTRALKIKPDSQDTKDRLTFAKAKLLRQVDVEMKREIEKKEKIFKIAGKKMPQKLQEAKPPQDKKSLIWESPGIELAEENNIIMARNIRYGSVAWAEGIKPQDAIVAIWGRLTGYLTLDEVINMLSESGFSEVKLTIQRQVDLTPPYVMEKISGINYPGLNLELKEQGLAISEVFNNSIAQQAGLKTGDLIFAINNKSTRYMPLKDANRLINVSRNSGVSLLIRRHLTLWRK